MVKKLTELIDLMALMSAPNASMQQSGSNDYYYFATHPVSCVLAITYVRGSSCWLLASGLQFLSGGGGGAYILAPGSNESHFAFTQKK